MVATGKGKKHGGSKMFLLRGMNEDGDDRSPGTGHRTVTQYCPAQGTGQLPTFLEKPESAEGQDFKKFYLTPKVVA